MNIVFERRLVGKITKNKCLSERVRSHGRLMSDDGPGTDQAHENAIRYRYLSGDIAYLYLELPAKRRTCSTEIIRNSTNISSILSAIVLSFNVALDRA